MSPKSLGFALLAAALVAAVIPSAGAQDACQTSFTLVGKPDLKWHVGNNANPTLTACPGEEVSFAIEIEGATPHDFVVQGVEGAPAKTAILSEGDTETYTMTAPASGSATYICQIHPTTMKGTVNFATQSVAEEGDNESPSVAVLGVLVAALGAALIVRRK